MISNAVADLNGTRVNCTEVQGSPQLESSTSVATIDVIAPQLIISKLLIIIMQLQALTYILLYMHTIMLFAVHPDPPDVDIPIVLSFETHM